MSRWWRCLFKPHIATLADLSRERDAQGVICGPARVTCRRCGRHFTAPYGLALPVRWVTKKEADGE